MTDQHDDARGAGHTTMAGAPPLTALARRFDRHAACLEAAAADPDATGPPATYLRAMAAGARLTATILRGAPS